MIKVENTSGFDFVNLKAQCTGKPKKTNGAYGLYPVNCENVLIDRCIAIGASDAGIYVGQSKMITVRNSEAYYQQRPASSGRYLENNSGKTPETALDKLQSSCGHKLTIDP